MSEAEERELNLRDYVAALVRRRKAALITAAAGVLLTLSLAFFLPPYYQSTGTILIEQQEVPQDLVRSTVTSYADQRVQVISQRVMTTQNLLQIIRRYDLYPSQRQRQSREEILQRMRDDITFKMISADVVDPRSGVPREATIAFSVAYTSRSPEQSVKVANELTTLYLNENLTERTRLAQDASGFLLTESDRLAKQIAELETKLAIFKSKHSESLPELASLNLQLLDRTEQELRDIQMRAMSLAQQRVYLEAQLVQIKPNSVLMSESGERILSSADRLKTLKSQLASAQAVYSPTHPDIVRMKREIDGLEAQTGATPATNDLLRQLESTRGELGQAREKYSPGHPDVQRLERQVASLEAAIAAEVKPASGGTASTGSQESADNPAYIQLQAQLAATRSDQAALEEQQRQLRAQIAGYQGRLTASPQIEKEYRELARDYESAQLRYREVRAKQMEAQLAQSLESDRKGERFTLIEPPLPPEEPVSPNRTAVVVIGLLLTLASCAGMVTLLEAVDTRVRGRLDMIELFSVPPLALVPYITTDAEMNTGRRKVQLSVGAAAVGCVLLVIAAHFLFRPLDVLWFVALRKFGM